jgi:ATP-dependent RNA helicase RhlB
MNKKPAKQRKEGAPRALIMAPTRELVMQIEKDAHDLAKYCGARILAIFGGIDYEKQRYALEDDYADIVMATPGRILDYYKQKVIRLDKVEILVLDEADRMLDMGFLPDMRRIIDATPPKTERQTMLFSATLPPEINRLAAMWTNNPISVEIEPEQVTSADVDLLAYIVSEDDKLALLFNLLHELKVSRAMIFANRKDQVRKLTERLKICNFICDMLTGDVTQSKRIKTLENLRNGKINILIATDVAGRGLHVEGIDVVFNYTLPNDPDDYVHRIGRTGRAGAKGVSISFASEEDSYVLPQIEAHIKGALTYLTPSEAQLAPIPEKYAIKFKNLKRKRMTAAAPKHNKGFDKRKRKK